MAKFELYHPILTPHYQLDWLTNFKVKDVNALRQTINPKESMLETANYVNREMSTIMNDQALTWGVSDKQQDDLLAIVNLAPADDQFKKAQLTITQVTKTSQSLVEEIENYMTEFAQNELQSFQLIVSLK
ncbi:GNAT family N-acetyltransferase [Secundilactobacillus hailunensis]|uniref:GNAT family N-acetyltransferase n=1 Tax=Secundilactobacillus hailunensis TaxID=2559923 RepID=A0ABW1TBP2_9LACO|nr:GNAT family N-acetyltransferase [Secundilactobacillus hailunensis]